MCVGVTHVGVTPTRDPPYGVGKMESLGVGRVRVVVLKVSL